MNDSTVLSLTFLEYQPKAAATILQEFAPEQVVEFIEQTPVPVLVPVVNNMASWPAARLLSVMSQHIAADVLHKMPANDAETLLRLMPDKQRNAILKHMPEDMAKNYTHKLIYPVTTVGAWMDTTVPSFTTDSSVNHCLDMVKRQKSHLGGVIIVVDNKKILVGLVEVEKLITSDGGQKLADLLDTGVEPLPASGNIVGSGRTPGVDPVSRITGNRSQQYCTGCADSWCLASGHRKICTSNWQYSEVSSGYRNRQIFSGVVKRAAAGNFWPCQYHPQILASHAIRNPRR